MTKSAGNCGFGHIYLRNPEWKILFFKKFLSGRLKQIQQKLVVFSTPHQKHLVQDYVIIRNFILHEIVTCNDRDPPWITRLIKKTIKDKNLFYQRFVKNADITNNDSNSERFC